MTQNTETKEHTHREIHDHPLWTFMTGMLLAALDQTIVSTALKSIVEDFTRTRPRYILGRDRISSYLNSIDSAVRKNLSDLYGLPHCFPICHSLRF
jgi:hypothetical protein